MRKSSTSEPSGADGLGADAGAAALDVLGPDLRDEPLQGLDERFFDSER